MTRTIDLAFTEPVDAGIVIDVAGYLNRDTRLAAAHVAARTRCDFCSTWDDD